MHVPQCASIGSWCWFWEEGTHLLRSELGRSGCRSCRDGSQSTPVSESPASGCMSYLGLGTTCSAASLWSETTFPGLSTATVFNTSTHLEGGGGLQRRPAGRAKADVSSWGMPLASSFLWRLKPPTELKLSLAETLCWYNWEIRRVQIGTRQT